MRDLVLFGLSSMSIAAIIALLVASLFVVAGSCSLSDRHIAPSARDEALACLTIALALAVVAALNWN
jgi:hypothetical protein